MAAFELKVYRLAIEAHPNADAIELARVGDYISIVKKGQYRTGDLACYIPEASIVPQDILERIGLWDYEEGKGKLAGKAGNRVKAIKLRGILSQGLIYDPLIGRPIVEHEDLTEILGITKWEPPVPIHMAGEVCNLFGHTISYDIENVKKFRDILEEGEPVAITEKLHGSWTCIGVVPGLNHSDLLKGDVVVSSKGLSAQGLAFKHNERNAGNLYIQMLLATVGPDGRLVTDRLRDLIKGRHLAPVINDGDPVYLLGETFGKGVQDLHYGQTKPTLRVFDVYVGIPGHGRYLDHKDKQLLLRMLGVESVPVLYDGPYSKAKLDELTDGKESITGAHVREGVVITPLKERYELELGRVILKSVSEKYLLRKGDVTEFN